MFAKVNIPCEDPSKNDLDMQGHNSNIPTNKFELFHHYLDEVELNKINILHLTFTVPL